MIRLALFLFALLPGLASAQTLTRVIVSDLETGAFPDGVAIQLQPVDTSNPTYEAVTDGSSGIAGAATFEDVAEGRYYALAAPESGYASLTSLGLSAGQFAAVLAVRPFSSEAGRLTGLAVDAETGRVLRFAQLAFATNGEAADDSLYFAATDADGRYAIPFAPGETSGQAYVRQPGPNGRERYDPLAFSVTVADGSPTTLDLAFTEAGQGTISGRVLDEDSRQPVENAGVTAISTGDGSAFSVDVETDGSYSLSVPEGTYVVRAADGFGTYVTEFYDDVTVRADATPVVVGDGNTVAGIDFGLQPVPDPFTVSVEGTVVDTNGAPVAGIYATILTASGAVVAQDSTRQDGTYQLSSRDPRLANNEIVVCFRSILFTFECYNDAPSIALADRLAVGSESVTFTGIDAELEGMAQGTLAGRVTDEAAGTGLAGVTVRAFPTDGGQSATGTTDADGRYSFRALAGEYILSAAPDLPYVLEYYDGARTFANATPVTVTDGARLDGLDFALARASDSFAVTIQGTVTDSEGDPVRGAIVSVLDEERFVAGILATSGADGQYTLFSSDARLAGARLAVFAADTTVANPRFEFYDGQPTLELADRLMVGTEPVTFTGIDFTLAAPSEDVDGLAISGTVRSKAFGGPLPAATVIAVRTDAPGFRAITTDAGGRYRMDGLAAGTYTVLFVAEDHTPAFYPDADSWQEGTSIALDSDVEGINGLIGGLNRPVGTRSRLAPFVSGPALLGAVRDENGGALRGALVVARDAEGAATAFALTDGSGEFAIEDLPAASATLQVDLARYAVDRRVLSPGGSLHLVSLSSQTSTASPAGAREGEIRVSVRPNPIAGRATVAFMLAAPGETRVSVYDALGREVSVLVEGARAEGEHEIELRTSGFAPGLYIVRVQAEGAAATQRVTVVR